MAVGNSLDLESDARSMIGIRDFEPVQFRQTVAFQDLGGGTRSTWRGDHSRAAGSEKRA
jgi:hypothetical protein